MRHVLYQVVAHNASQPLFQGNDYRQALDVLTRWSILLGKAYPLYLVDSETGEVLAESDD